MKHLIFLFIVISLTCCKLDNSITKNDQEQIDSECPSKLIENGKDFFGFIALQAEEKHQIGIIRIGKKNDTNPLSVIYKYGSYPKGELYDTVNFKIRLSCESIYIADSIVPNTFVSQDLPLDKTYTLPLVNIYEQGIKMKPFGPFHVEGHFPQNRSVNTENITIQSGTQRSNFYKVSNPGFPNIPTLFKNKHLVKGKGENGKEYYYYKAKYSPLSGPKKDYYLPITSNENMWAIIHIEDLEDMNGNKISQANVIKYFTPCEWHFGDYRNDCSY